MKNPINMYRLTSSNSKQLKKLSKQKRLQSLQSEVLRKSLNLLVVGKVEDPEVSVEELQSEYLEVLEALGQTKEAIQVARLQRYAIKALTDRLRQAASEGGKEHLASWVSPDIIIKGSDHENLNTSI